MISTSDFSDDTPDELFLDDVEDEIGMEDRFCHQSLETGNEDESGSLQDHDNDHLLASIFFKTEPLDQDYSDRLTLCSKKELTRKKRRQGTHGHQDPKKARTAQVRKWGSSGDQSTSLANFLECCAKDELITLRREASLLPHGIAGFEVTDADAFLRARMSWFQRDDPPGAHGPAAADNGNSVHQAFRRCGLIPERKPGTRGYDWSGG
eukprot:CAMPEP_0172169430 /NCGR_PEP_ID=MMETSP1050-20130122/10699_1 /TAXON_ID=233186 /ORGANISM="Cryptomonas curvata, Strain CCAP979/52" /LENGTH=207 /DNA_ID=CAMNT_0012840483 /DNA_START=34 /DNA_END=653 /DNA_ORIENTATION=+